MHKSIPGRSNKD